MLEGRWQPVAHRNELSIGIQFYVLLGFFKNNAPAPSPESIMTTETGPDGIVQQIVTSGPDPPKLFPFWEPKTKAVSRHLVSALICSSGY